MSQPNGQPKCSVEGCNARLRVDSSHTECSRHRPQPKGGHNRSKDAQTRAQRKHRERMANAGVPAGWEV